uniref:Uncharacterized protein n=1 Tax=Oryza brachyantha TaxID=4533 RepID=J3MF51_ORYBR
MKKEAVNMRPTATMTTASVGYQSTGTGLEIAFAACPTPPPPPTTAKGQRITVASQNPKKTLDPHEIAPVGLTISPDLSRCRLYHRADLAVVAFVSAAAI